jgi:hypothetical protein
MKHDEFYNNIASIDSSHVNEEYVYPCITKKHAAYLHPEIENAETLITLIEKNLVTIVTQPGVDSIVQASKEDQLQILFSLRENGRVLEAKDTIELDGTTYKMLIK